MDPVDFAAANRTAVKPEGMSDDECGPLRLCDTGEHLVSCWRPTAEDRERIARGEPVWLWIWGRAHPVVAMSTDNPFPTERA